MITIDALNNAEEQEILSIAQQQGQNAGQLIASIVRGYLEDLHDAQRSETVLAGIENGESELLDWDDVKAVSASQNPRKDAGAKCRRKPEYFAQQKRGRSSPF